MLSTALPSPDRFARLLVDEPRVLLQDFLDRFQSLCQLELQLPSLRPEDLKNMVSSLLLPKSAAFQAPGTQVSLGPPKIRNFSLCVCVCVRDLLPLCFSPWTFPMWWFHHGNV